MQHVAVTSSRSVLFFSLTIALLFILGSPLSRGQLSEMDNCSGGLLYYLAFPDTSTNTWDARFPAQLIKTDTKSFAFYIYSPVAQQIKIGRVDSWKETVSVFGGEVYEHETVQKSVPLASQVNTPQRNVIEVRAQYPIIVYGYLLTAFGCAAFNALPVESWGTEYYAATWPGQIVRNVFPNGKTDYRAIPRDAPAEILIIAAYDSTEVTIDPTAQLMDCPGCPPIPSTIRLNSGETYMVKSVVDTSLQTTAGQGDLGGTRIRSNKPVGVISGNTRLMHNAGARPSLAENSSKDMALEWITPLPLHGTEFVFTPTWDDRSFQPGRDVGELRQGEHVRLFATENGGNVVARLRDGADSLLNAGGQLDVGEFAEERVNVQRSINEARAYKTSRAAFGVASPESVVKFNGSGSDSGAPDWTRYLSWSTYMVELVPREHWTSFAPIFTPLEPKKMKHYLNVVTDTLHRSDIYIHRVDSAPQLFAFNRGVVPGTDLIWGSIELTGNAQYIVQGESGARFTGHVYGSYGGKEEFYPKASQTPSPAEYHEDIALMYAYPLAPSRCLLAPPDQYDITTQEDCDGMTINIRAVNPNPAGLRSIMLLPDSSSNLRFAFVNPADSVLIVTENLSETAIRVVPIDRKKDAYGVVLIHDRTRGGTVRVPYRFEVERVVVDSATGVNFGTMQTGVTTERTITIANPLQKDIVVRRPALVRGDQDFRVVETEPSFNWSSGADSIVLKSGDTLRVRVGITPTTDRQNHDDSLRVELGCSTFRLRLRGASAMACLSVGDLDFGRLQSNQAKTMMLEVCNTGEFPVTFYDSTATGGENRLSFSGTDFIVADNHRNLLVKAKLDRGECIKIPVRFRAKDTGVYRITARFWINGRSCRDTSVWTAYVVDTTLGVAAEEVSSGNAVTEIVPNPFTQETRILFHLARGGETTVEIHDGEGRIVGTLLNDRLGAGEHELRWNGHRYAAGTYYVLIRSGAWSETRKVVLVR